MFSSEDGSALGSEDSNANRWSLMHALLELLDAASDECEALKLSALHCTASASICSCSDNFFAMGSLFSAFTGCLPRIDPPIMRSLVSKERGVLLVESEFLGPFVPSPPPIEWVAPLGSTWDAQTREKKGEERGEIIFLKCGQIREVWRRIRIRICDNGERSSSLGDKGTRQRRPIAALL